MIGQSVSTVTIEVELWYRRDEVQRASAEEHVEQIVMDSGGNVLDRSQIGDIGYHALLAAVPIQQVRSVLNDGAAAIRVLTTDEVMFVSPFTPMTVGPATLGPEAVVRFPSGERVEGLPRVALSTACPSRIMRH